MTSACSFNTVHFLIFPFLTLVIFNFRSLYYNVDYQLCSTIQEFSLHILRLDCNGVISIFLILNICCSPHFSWLSLFYKQHVYMQLCPFLGLKIFLSEVRLLFPSFPLLLWKLPCPIPKLGPISCIFWASFSSGLSQRKSSFRKME